MSQKDRRCRHNRAWPTLYGVYPEIDNLVGKAGYFWCPDCGAVRGAKTGENGGVYPSEPFWVRPGETWQKDMEKNRKAEGK